MPYLSPRDLHEPAAGHASLSPTLCRSCPCIVWVRSARDVRADFTAVMCAHRLPPSGRRRTACTVRVAVASDMGFVGQARGGGVLFVNRLTSLGCSVARIEFNPWLYDDRRKCLHSEFLVRSRCGHQPICPFTLLYL
jgi:hypothetical protein